MELHPIEILVQWRYDKFISEFNINIRKFNSNNKRKENWIKLKEQLISRGNVIDTDSFIHCYMFIYNIIWKNIINYSVSDIEPCGYNWHCHMLYTTPKKIRKHYYHEPLLQYDILERNNYAKNNLNIIQNTITTYFKLINTIVGDHLVSDLSKIINICMFDLILMI